MKSDSPKWSQTLQTKVKKLSSQNTLQTEVWNWSQSPNSSRSLNWSVSKLKSESLSWSISKLKSDSSNCSVSKLKWVWLQAEVNLQSQRLQTEVSLQTVVLKWSHSSNRSQTLQTEAILYTKANSSEWSQMLSCFAFGFLQAQPQWFALHQ